MAGPHVSGPGGYRGDQFTVGIIASPNPDALGAREWVQRRLVPGGPPFAPARFAGRDAMHSREDTGVATLNTMVVADPRRVVLVTWTELRPDVRPPGAEEALDTILDSIRFAAPADPQLD